MADQIVHSATLPAKVVSIPPNQTLYITNLPSAKIQKNDLRTALYMLFSTYGPVLDVVALKTSKMRGQAHIAFRDIQTATQALRSLDGFEFFGHRIKIQYAKSKSNAIAKLDGTFKIPTTSSAAAVEVSDLQQSIFNAPAPGTTTFQQPGHSLPPKPTVTTINPNKLSVDRAATEAGSLETKGTKRLREEDDEGMADSDSDVAMEEDSDNE